jgi:hypothetical protein
VSSANCVFRVACKFFDLIIVSFESTALFAAFAGSPLFSCSPSYTL